MVPKVLEQCKMRGHLVSMGHAYTSPKLFILWKEKGYFIQGTVRTDS